MIFVVCVCVCVCVCVLWVCCGCIVCVCVGTNISPLESFISFHDNLLVFFESFLMVYRVPLFPLLFPIVWKLDPVVS